jgi:hypothetical protein
MSGRTAMNTNAIFLRHTLCTLRLGDRGPWRLTKSDAQPWSGPHDHPSFDQYSRNCSRQAWYSARYRCKDDTPGKTELQSIVPKISLP